MRTPFHISALLPTNRAAWRVVTLLLFSLLWLPPFDLLDFSREFFDPDKGGSVGEGVRVVVPISMALLGITCAVGWCIQGVSVAAFRRWIHPRLERRYGAGVSLTHLLSPRRLWTLRRFRRAAYTFVGLYLLAWLATALLGPASVIHRFEADHAFGYRGFSEELSPSTRVQHLNVREVFTRYQRLPAIPWHYISPPRAICPFVLVSDFGYVYGSLAGAGGRTWTFWFFGWQVKIYSQYYW